MWPGRRTKPSRRRLTHFARVETGTLQFYDLQRQGLVENHLGHMLVGTWEDAAWALVEHGGYEWVDPEAKYWIRQSLKNGDTPG